MVCINSEPVCVGTAGAGITSHDVQHRSVRLYTLVIIIHPLTSSFSILLSHSVFVVVVALSCVMLFLRFVLLALFCLECIFPWHRI